MTIQLEHWYQWKTRCAVLKCNPDIEQDLSQMLLWMSRKLAWRARRAETFTAKDMACIFDSYTHRLKRNQTVFFKEWMLEAVDQEEGLSDKLALCNQRAKGVLKNALDQYVRGECNHSQTRKALITKSLDENLSGAHGQTIPQADRLTQKSAAFLGNRADEIALPGTHPANAAAEAEFLAEAALLSNEIWSEAGDRQHALLLALALGVPMTNEALLEHLDLSVSTLYEARTKHATDLFARISKKFPEDTREQHFLLAGLVQRELQEKALAKKPWPAWCNQYLGAD